MNSGFHDPKKAEIHMSGGGILLPKFMPISFSGVCLVFEVFQDTWRSNKENPSCRSRSVLISFWMLTIPWIFYPIRYLVLPACISFCSVSGKSGSLLFLPCSQNNAAAHIEQWKTQEDPTWPQLFEVWRRPADPSSTPQAVKVAFPLP